MAWKCKWCQGKYTDQGKVRVKAQVQRERSPGQQSASPLGRMGGGYRESGSLILYLYGASEGPDPTFPQLSAQVTDTCSIRGIAKTQNKFYCSNFT